MKSKILVFLLANIFLVSWCVNSEDHLGFSLKEENFNEALDFSDYGSNSSASFRMSDDPNYIKFYLYRNASDEDDRVEILLNDVLSLYKSGYNFSIPLKLLVHGVLSSSTTIYDMQTIKLEYLRAGTHANIVMVDYGPLTVSEIPFIFSTLSFLTILVQKDLTNIVADRTSEFLEFLLTQKAISSPEAIHIVAFSVGSHIAGAIGRNVFSQTGHKVGRITGLDPSPQFPYKPKLEPTDAEFVDVTFTALGEQSTFKTEGHAMFFMNGGGPHQQHCPNFKPFTEIYCSHTTSVYYFAKSIRKSSTLGCLCRLPCLEPPDVCRLPVAYGESIPEKARGNYYVKI